MRCSRYVRSCVSRVSPYGKFRRAELPVSEVAARVGYSDPAHFTRAFRRWTGHSPLEFHQLTSRTRGRTPP